MALESGDLAGALLQLEGAAEEESLPEDAKNELTYLRGRTAYDRGEGVARSPDQAARWYRRAAAQGHLAGQYNFASMCEQGQGVARDPIEAYAWYALSVRQGMGTLGDAALERVGRALGEAERDRAIERARRYEAAYRMQPGAPPEVTARP